MTDVCLLTAENVHQLLIRVVLVCFLFACRNSSDVVNCMAMCPLSEI